MCRDNDRAPVERRTKGWRWLLWKVFGSHKWGYRNPYYRICKVCDRREVSHCADFESWYKSWWETFDDGDERRHYVSTEPE